LCGKDLQRLHPIRSDLHRENLPKYLYGDDIAKCTIEYDFTAIHFSFVERTKSSVKFDGRAIAAAAALPRATPLGHAKNQGRIAARACANGGQI
jgi:hypothetical protein